RARATAPAPPYAMAATPAPHDPAGSAGATPGEAKPAGPGAGRQKPGAGSSAQNGAAAAERVPAWEDHGGRKRSARLQIDQQAVTRAAARIVGRLTTDDVGLPSSC